MPPLKLIVSAALLVLPLAACTGFGAGSGDNCRVVTTERDGDDAQRLSCSGPAQTPGAGA